MSTKVKRKVTVESSKESDDQPRRPSVFERLGPGGANMAPLPTERRSRQDHEDRCRNWERTGNCSYGNTCRYKHDNFATPNTSTRRTNKTEKEMDKKDLRHKVRSKRDDPKEPRTASASPKKKGSKRSLSRSRKGEHESKIKSTVVVTRPRSPGATNPEITETKKKGEGNWEDDSDDWPMDAAQLDYKEELTLERKRQQLQRELELELQKERMLNENVTITKTVSFSGSSSSSSSSDSGSISSSSGSSSSSSEEDSNESTSSSSSSSSSSPSIKKKSKKSSAKASISKKSSKGRVKDDYDKIKSSRAAKSQKHRSPSPSLEKISRKKNHDKRNAPSISPKRKKVDNRNEGGNRSGLNVKVKGPRTPSPIQPTRKQRQWAESSSADSRSAEIQRGRNKRHKKKKDIPKIEKRKLDRGPPTPPPLSSPNRTALMPVVSKKSKIRDESGGKKSRHHGRESPPMLLPRTSGGSSQPTKLLGNQRYIADEKTMERSRPDDRGKPYSRKEDVFLLQKQRNDSRERIPQKRGRISPRKESHKASLSPHKDRYESDMIPIVSRKMYPLEKDKNDRRRQSISPVRMDRRKQGIEMEKKRDLRDLSPRDHDPRRDNQYRNVDVHGYDKRGGETKVKRLLSPEMKKGRDDRGRDYAQKERVMDYETPSWQADHRKPNTSTGRRSPEPRSRQDIHSQQSLSRNDRSRDVDPDRKKRKDRDLSVRSVDDAERSRLSSPRRSQSPIHGHHSVREIEPLTDARGRIYEPDVPPPVERDYAYGYEPLHDPYMSERLLPPDYETDVLPGPPLYPPEVYSENRYRRNTKEPLDRYGPRDVMSPRDILPHRDIISLTGRNEDYLGDVGLDDRSYDERWSRGRGNREEWDHYPSPALPPHVTAAMDEDRYGMPRRRRGSPNDWQRNKFEDREPPANMRPPGRGQIAGRDGRSPPLVKGQGSNRGSWNERGGRHDARNNDRRIEEDPQKNLDDRKGKIIRKDRIKKEIKEEIVEEKIPVAPKPTKRPHSPSPTAKKPVKKRKIEAFDILKYHGATEDKTAKKPVKKRKVQAFDILKYHGATTDDKTANKPVIKRKVQAFDILKYHGATTDKNKRNRENAKNNEKAAIARNQKIIKQESIVPEPTVVPDKDTTVKTTTDVKIKKKEDRKSRKDDATRGDDDFSDWSDDDLDLLTRDDFAEQEAGSENSKQRYREENEDSLGSTKKKEKGSVREHSLDSKKSKDSSSRTSSKERSNDEANVKEHKLSESKDTDNQESFSIKEDTATDIDEYITAESVDYDPISDDELDALIEEPDDSLTKPVVENEKSKIVDALDVDWSALMKESKAEFIPGTARRRFKAAHVLSRIGFSQALAGSELSQKIIDSCQKQLDEEEEINERESADDSGEKNAVEKKKFVMEHKLASFHVSISQNKKERVNLFREVGPYRRALCARRDLQIRKMLCKPLNKFTTAPSVSYTPQYTVVDKELYKQSLELLKMKKTPETPPQTVPVC